MFNKNLLYLDFIVYFYKFFKNRGKNEYISR